jgi:hypothetical protein
MRQRLLLCIGIVCVCLGIALLLAVSGAAQTNPPAPLPFSWRPAPPVGACVCSPSIFLYMPTHQWWVLADGSGRLEITLIAKGPNETNEDGNPGPPTASSVKAKIFDILNNQEVATIGPVGYPLSTDPPYSEKSGTVTLTGVPPYSTYRVEISREPTGPEFTSSLYRLEMRGAVQSGWRGIGFLAPVEQDPYPSEDHLVRWGFNVGDGELSVKLSLGAPPLTAARKTKLRVIDPSGAIAFEDLQAVEATPPRVIEIPNPNNKAGQWWIEVQYADGLFNISKQTGTDRGIYLMWITDGGTTEGRFLVSVTRDGQPTNLLPIYLTFTNNTTGRTFSGVTGTNGILLEGFSGQFPSGHYTVTARPPAPLLYRVTPPSIQVDLWCHLDVPLAFDVPIEPQVGFVTGGGWIDSPAGAYRADPLLAGRASFGVNAKYLHGGDRLAGDTEFQLQFADINFHSREYLSLFIGGPNSSLAVWNGLGTINGTGQYRFQFMAQDGRRDGSNIDKMRMRIWDEVTGSVIYDTGTPLTPLASGSIVVHIGN